MLPVQLVRTVRAAEQSAAQTVDIGGHFSRSMFLDHLQNDRSPKGLKSLTSFKLSCGQSPAKVRYDLVRVQLQGWQSHTPVHSHEQIILHPQQYRKTCPNNDHDPRAWSV
jgi:hypothetical protein